MSERVEGRGWVEVETGGDREVGPWLRKVHGEAEVSLIETSGWRREEKG